MKIAFIHDWLIGMRGGEKVLEAACELYPDAEIYTLLYNPDRVSDTINRRRVRTSWLQKLPFVYRYYRNLLPVMTRVVRGWDLSRFDLVISFSHCVAKGIQVEKRTGSSGTGHICYCFTPMRYIYSQFDNYFPNGSRPWAKRLAQSIRPFLIRWDRRTSAGVDHFVGCSENVRERIQETYGREAQVIYPPVDTEFYTPSPSPRPSLERQTIRADSSSLGETSAPYYLAVGALVPYKRIDLAIEACRILGARLKIVGVGTEENRLKALAAGAPSGKFPLGPAGKEGRPFPAAPVEFLGWQSDESLRALYQGCEALLFPQDEDFGIAAVEAQACGRPVVAFAKGGALETVRDGVTGVFFREQTAQALAEAVRRSRTIPWDSAAIRDNACRFSRDRFKEQLSALVNRVFDGNNSPRPTPKIAVPA